jgi:hypothetical protein
MIFYFKAGIPGVTFLNGVCIMRKDRSKIRVKIGGGLGTTGTYKYSKANKAKIPLFR